MRRVLVGNIPLHTYAVGWVEVPDDTTDEGLNTAIRDALIANGYEASEYSQTYDLDESACEKWRFDIEEAP